MDFSLAEKMAVIKITIEVMKADGMLHPEEMRFFEKLKATIDFDIPAVEDAEDLDKAKALATLKTMNYAKKKILSRILREAAIADAMLHKKEIGLIIDIFKKIGLEEEIG